MLQSGTRGVIIGSRIINVFKKISTLHSAIKRAPKAGGKSVKKLVHELEVGAKSQFLSPNRYGFRIVRFGRDAI